MARPDDGESGTGVDGAATASLGTPLADRYDVLGELGRGGFAAVYKAHDRKLDRLVAVKRLLAEGVEGKQAELTLSRFRREARAIAGLNHRNIVQVFDHDRDAQGHYIVMELVAGGSLRDLLSERGKLPVPEAVKLMTSVCQGLAFAHKRSLIHRDIKPANILVVREGDALVPKIVDFGLARAGAESDLSVTGYGMGTPAYMPPEQRRDAKSVNHTADLYAVGKTLYEVVSGEFPDDVLPSKIPPPAALATIIFKCVETRPEDRYFSADDLIRDLEALDTRSGSVAANLKSEAAVNACPSCGSSNPEDVKFCEACGTGLSRRCPECDRENSVHKQFCGGCGTDVAGFIQVQETLQRIQSYAAERKWNRVTKEFGLLPEKVRLPGAKGKAVLAQLQALRDQAQAAMTKREELRRAVQAAIEAERFEDALNLLPQYQQLEPDNAEMNRLPLDLIARIDDRDWRNSEAQASAKIADQDFDGAIGIHTAYLERHPDGKHATTARQLSAEELPEAKRVKAMVSLLGSFVTARNGRQFAAARETGTRIEALGKELLYPQVPAPLVLDSAGCPLSRPPAELLAQVRDELAEIDAREAQAAAYAAEAALDEAASRFEGAERQLQRADELFPGNRQVTESLGRVRLAAQTQRLVVETFQADVRHARTLLEAGKLPDCGALLSDLASRQKTMVVAPESSWNDAWVQAVAEVADLKAELTDLSDRESRAGTLVAEAADAERDGRLQQAEHGFLEAGRIYPAIPGWEEGLSRVRAAGSQQRQAVAEFTRDLARARALLDARDRQGCRALVDQLRQRQAETRVDPDSEWSQSWCDAGAQIEGLTDLLSSIETQMERLSRAADATFRTQDYQACLEACAAGAELSAERTPCLDLAMRARQAVADVESALRTASCELQAGHVGVALKACRRAAALQKSNPASLELLTRILAARVRLRRRRLTMAAIVVAACLAGAWIAYEVRYTLRCRTFEDARRRGRGSEATRLAELVRYRYKPAGAFLAGLTQARQAQTEAERAWAGIKGSNLDPGQGFAGRLTAIEGDCAALSKSFDQGHWEECLAASRRVVSLADEIVAEETARQTAAEDRLQALTLWDQLKGRCLDPAQGMGQRLAAVEAKCREVDELFAGGRWKETAAAASSVLVQVGEVTALQTQRQESLADWDSATTARDEVRKRNIDPGQGLGELLAAIEAKCRDTPAVIDAGRWEDVVASAKTVQALVNQVTRLQDERAAALTAREESARRKQSLKPETKELVAKEWQEAEAEEVGAREVFEKGGSFTDAQARWRESARRWQAVETRAGQVLACRRSRRAFDDAVGEGDRPELLETCGGPEWEEVSRQAKAASDTADADPVVARAAYESALARLPAALRGAELRRVLMQAQRIVGRLETMPKGDTAVLGVIKEGIAPLVEFEGSSSYRELSPAQQAELKARKAEVEAFSTKLGIVPGPGQPWTNTLGMEFLPVEGARVLIAKWETRVQDFDAFVKDSRHDATKGVFSLGPDGWKIRGKSWSEPGFAQTPSHPVVGVNWADAQAFCRWLTEREAHQGRLLSTQKYRLPTDQEWSAAVGLPGEVGLTPEDRNERVADVYPWGNAWPPPARVANVGASLKVDPEEATAPVGSFPPNRSGFHDLGGNVWEWCEDWYDRSQRNRFLRGGSWASKNAKALLSSTRCKSPPESRVDDYGFRCVVELGTE